MPIRAILFDLGNTLWHIPEPPPVQQIRHETVSRILGLLRSWDIEIEGQHRMLGRDIGDDRAEELWHTWNLGGDFFGRRLYDDTLDTLETLRTRGYRLGCVTN